MLFRSFDVCGSKSYIAPEVLSGRGYDGFAADMWSCGVCMFALLFRFLPVEMAKPNDLYFRKLVRVQLEGKPSAKTIFSWYNRNLEVSLLATDLVDALIKTEAHLRPSVTEVALHPWFYTPLPPTSSGFTLDTVKRANLFTMGGRYQIGRAHV